MFILILCAILDYVICQLICIDNFQNKLQMETSIEIPEQNCQLNLVGEQLTNMKSKNATITIYGQNILLDENIVLLGFYEVEFVNISIDTRMNSIKSDSQLIFKNVTFTKNCNYSSPKITLFNSSLIQGVFKNRNIFQSDMEIKNLIIEDCSFFNSALTRGSITLFNILLEGVHFVNSTLGKIDLLSKITLQNSFIASSNFVKCNIIQDITIQNSYIILSTLFLTPASLHLKAINVTLSQSLLFYMENDNQVQLKDFSFQNLECDSKLIDINSPYINITDFQIMKVSSRAIFSLNCSESFFKNFTIRNIKGNFLFSNHTNELRVLINLFDFSEIQSEQLFDFRGVIQLKTGKFYDSNSSLINSHTILEARLDSLTFINLTNSVILNLGDLSTLNLQNIIVNNCELIYFANLNTIITANLHNITFQDCEECVLFNINNTLCFMKDISIINSKNFGNSLFSSVDSTIIIKRVSLNNVESNANTILSFSNGETIEFTSLNIQNITCPFCQGIISIKLYHTAKFNKSTLTNLTTMNGSINVQDVTNFTANYNSFTNINSDSGSCFYIKNSSIKIHQNSIQLLNANLGGMIFFHHNLNNTFYIDDNTVQNSTALKGNQVYMITQTIMEEKSDYFIDGPVFLDMFNQTLSLDKIIKKQHKLNLQSFKSGQQINFNFSILNSNKQKLCNFDSDIYFNNYSYTFDKFKCSYLISFSHVQQKPTTELFPLRIIIPSLTLYNNSFAFMITLNYIDCEIGEQWIRSSCQKCLEGTYSLQSQAPCLQCIAQASLCPGGATIDIKEGYWRPNNLTDVIEKCSSPKSSCYGGQDNFTCGEGYIGALCQDCDYYSHQWDKPYARDMTNTCKPCNYSVMDNVKVVFAFLWILAALYFSVCGALRMAKAQLIGHYLRKIGLFFGTRSSLIIDQTEVLIKMVSTYFQLLSILLVLNMQLPQPFHFLSQLIGNPLQTLGLQIECLLLKPQFQIEIVYLKQIWNLLISFIIISFFLFLYLIQSLCKNLEYAILTIFINSMIQIYFYFQGDIIEGMFETLFCIEASKQNYIQASTQYICYSHEHQTYIRALIIPTLIIVGIFIPFFYCLKLCKNKLKLWTCKIRLPYGYLFMEYKNQFYYWEFIRFIVKSIFYVLSTLLIQDFKLLFLFVILVLLIYLELLNKNKPYLEQKFNTLDKISTQLELLSLILAYIQDEQQNIGIFYISNILIYLFNLIFIIYFVYKILMELSLEYLKKCQDYMTIMINRFPLLEKCFKKPVPSMMPTRINYLWKKARLHVFKFISQLGNQTNSDVSSLATTAKGKSFAECQEPTLLYSLKPSFVRFLRNQSTVQQKEDHQLPSLPDLPVSQQNQSISINQSQLLDKSELSNTLIKMETNQKIRDEKIEKTEQIIDKPDKPQQTQKIKTVVHKQQGLKVLKKRRI